jgi:hypothetical protein
MAMPDNKGGSANPDNFRLWYGRMFLPPPTALSTAHGASFGAVRTLAAELGLVETYATTAFTRPRQSEDPDHQAAVKSLHTDVLRPLKFNFSWAVPSDEALGALAAAGEKGIVEVGCGSGYWARLLEARGVKVWPLDRQIAGEESPPAFTTIYAGGPPSLRKVSGEAALFLCYPDEGPVAKSCLKYYAGNTVCYVGPATLQPKADSPHSTACADEDFFAELEKSWSLTQKIVLPLSHLFCNDALFVFARKKPLAVQASAGEPDLGAPLAAPDPELPRTLAQRHCEGWSAFRAALVAFYAPDVQLVSDSPQHAICRRCGLAFPKQGFSKKSWKKRSEKDYAPQCVYLAADEKENAANATGQE